MTAVARNVFTSAGRVGDHRVRGDDREFSRAVATAVAPQIAPVRESRLGGAARANVRVPPRNVVDRQVVVKRNPPPPVTRFTRSTGGRPEPLREADGLNSRPRVRDDRDDGRVAVDRDRPDRPPRTEMSSPKTPPRVQTVAPDQRGSAERPRQDRQPRTETSSPKMQPREERARQQQERSQLERSQQEQRVQMFREQAVEQRRQQVDSERAQRSARPPEQRERNVERPRVEPRQQSS